MQTDNRRGGPRLALLAALSFCGASGYLHAQNPSAVSVTPSSGSGAARTFSFLYSDPNGATNISTVYMNVNASLTPSYACYVLINRASSVLYLRKDDNTDWFPPVAVGSGSTTVENGQCRINAPSSSITAAGNNLTVNLSISFKAGFAAPPSDKNLYMLVLLC